MMIDQTVWMLMLKLSIPGLLIGFGFGLLVGLMLIGFSAYRNFMRGRESMFEDIQERRVYTNEKAIKKLYSVDQTSTDARKSQKSSV